MYRFLFTYLFCASFLNLSAQGFQVNFQGQKQQGMGFAGTALFQDAASIFYNAGSIAFSNENSVNVSVTPIFANVLYVDSATGGAYRTENPVGTPFCAYGLFQHKKLEKFKMKRFINKIQSRFYNHNFNICAAAGVYCYPLYKGNKNS